MERTPFLLRTVGEGDRRLEGGPRRALCRQGVRCSGTIHGRCGQRSCGLHRIVIVAASREKDKQGRKNQNRPGCRLEKLEKHPKSINLQSGAFCKPVFRNQTLDEAPRPRQEWLVYKSVSSTVDYFSRKKITPVFVVDVVEYERI